VLAFIVAGNAQSCMAAFLLDGRRAMRTRAVARPSIVRAAACP
jgi:hypothetical protein